MTSNYKRILAIGWAIALAVAVPSKAEANDLLFVSTGDATRAPIGWVEFCAEHPFECKASPAAPRDVVLSNKAWADLTRINKWVNENVTPMTDLEHWGLVEKWSYPDDGYGDCEDYVLLKRRMLMEAGWPRAALLVTVVREKNGNGHAVLTVKTDKGEFILDNQEERILLWSETSYRYVKRQSQGDPNRWVALGDPRPTTATASSR
jgi:predicted transglutaminase-like cysteine proteinase